MCMSAYGISHKRFCKFQKISTDVVTAGGEGCLYDGWMQPKPLSSLEFLRLPQPINFMKKEVHQSY